MTCQTTCRAPWDYLLAIPRYSYCPITSPTDIDLLQHAGSINLLLDWCGTWLSSLNFTKCKHMSIGRKLTANQYYFLSIGVNTV